MGGLSGECSSLTARRRRATPRRIASATPGWPRGWPRSPTTRARGSRTGVSAMTLAMRGCWSSSDSSPKNCPGPSSAIVRPSRTTRAVPDDDEEEAGPDLALAGDRATRLEGDLGGLVGDARPAPRPSTPWKRATSRRSEIRASWLSPAIRPPPSRRGGAARRVAPSSSPGDPARPAPSPSVYDGTRRRLWRAGGPMATQDEIVDTLAGFALFADLPTPQLSGVAHTSRRRVFPEGERILRQGLTGLGVLHHPRRRGGDHRRRRAARDPRPGRVLRRGLDPPRRAARRRRRRHPAAALHRPRRARRSRRSS